MSLSRDAFFARTELPREEVPVPALGGSVWVRTMTAGERDQFEADHARLRNTDFRARVVAACACDAAGAPLFGPADVAELSKLPTTVTDPILSAALRLNGMSGDAQEDAAKN